MWTDLRIEIEKIKAELLIPETAFRALKLNEWQGLEEKIYQQFCHLNHPTARPTWMWTRFKLDTAWLPYAEHYPAEYLSKLVEADEHVWILLNETVNEHGKFWFYEGLIGAAQQIIAESSYIDEVLVVSKKLKWLLCITHHDDLGATGEKMPDKLRQLNIR
ncbi:DUF6756 family protein [Hymenobacter persicinus]|uniref:Uncharacterized protein n=1 Tax=Hymenobacter persicinus TaxID=2025506 RepID=A0A4Q5LD97_9BACT|nr:DUF6756 family protein [Hymenobacter persicinus]RYU79546.1 hypothetical protein EWM57_10280 [Hymenobacter persicinus]